MNFMIQNQIESIQIKTKSNEKCFLNLINLSGSAFRYLANTNPAPMNIQHMYHYNAMAAQPNFMNPIAQQGQLGAALAGGF